LKINKMLKKCSQAKNRIIGFDYMGLLLAVDNYDKVNKERIGVV